MNHEIYDELAQALNERKPHFHCVPSDEYYALISEYFTPEEAEIACSMPIEPITAEELAGLSGMNCDDLSQKLENMAAGGLVRVIEKEGKKYYELLPLAPGIIELDFIDGHIDDQLKRRAGLLSNYMLFLKSQSLWPPSAVTPESRKRRAIPVDKAIICKASILPYDEVMKLIDSSEHIAAGICGCRHTAEVFGKSSCSAPKENMCMILGASAEFAASRGFIRQISKNEARNVIDEAEKFGLIHQYTNNKEQYIDLLCNCCGCHCQITKDYMRTSSPGNLAVVNWIIEIDGDACSGCGLCIDRCWMKALKMEGDTAVSDANRCIGCGLCIYVCPTDALKLLRREIHA